MDFNKIVSKLLEDDKNGTRSVSWLARRLSKSRQNTASVLETNNPTLKTIESIAKVFGLTASELLALGEE